MKKIEQAKNVLIVTHDRPDGDALSSACAMIDFVSGQGKNCLAYCFNDPPQQYSFLPHIQQINSDKTKLNFSQFDLIIVLDCGQLNRTKLNTEIANKLENQFIIEFDHHPKIDSYADIEIKLTQLSSTAEVLYNFFKINNIRINKNIANCILTGISTDTGNFLYEITTQDTVRIASEMLARGARFPQILEGTWRNKSLAGMKMWGKIMSTLKINQKYKMAYTILLGRDFEELGATDEELEGVAGFLSNLSDADTLLFLRQLPDGRIKGSFRSMKEGIDISKLAQILGGGGHPRASAFVLDADLKKTAKGWEVK